MSFSVDVHEDIEIAQTVKNLALEGYEGPGRTKFESQEKYRWLRETGSRLWLDTGDSDAAENVWASELEALTTNNTLVNQVVQTGAMDGLVDYAVRGIRKARPDISEQDLVIEIAFLINARLALGLVQMFGAHVSVELHPDTGFDVQRTLMFARRYYDINPDFFYIKIPLTPDGFISTRILSNEGIPINYTLGFSARQNYLATHFSRPAFVNVFLGRLNQVVEENSLGKPENIGEKTTLASQEAVQSLRKTYLDIPTNQIAASMRDGKQVPLLAGVDVLTIPPKVAGEYLEMDISRDDIRCHSSRELRVELFDSGPAKIVEVNKLWEVDEDFIAFTEDAVKIADQMKCGGHLMDLADKHDVDLFHKWTREERQAIRDKDKIPDVSQWPGVPLDELMSISALESFAKDQSALDERIKSLISEAG